MNRTGTELKPGSSIMAFHSARFMYPVMLPRRICSVSPKPFRLKGWCPYIAPIRRTCKRSARMLNTMPMANGGISEMGADSGASSAVSRPKRLKRNRRWVSLLERYEAGDYLVVPLTSASDLRDEAWAMSHCVGRNYPTWCKEGFIRVFSIRDIDGRRKATASLVFDYERNRWCVEQCKGYANCEVCWIDCEPSDVFFVVEDMARLYQKAFEASGRETP